MKRIPQFASPLILAACLSATLAACGGSSNSVAVTPPPPPPPSPVMAMLDAFGNYVLTLIGSTSNTAEAIAVDSTTVTSPDNTEPAAI